MLYLVVCEVVRLDAATTQGGTMYNMNNVSPEQLLEQARMYSQSECHSKSFDLYLTAFKKWPQLKEQAEVEFRNLLECYNKYLFSDRKISEIFNNFERAEECFRENIYLLNDIGRYLYKLDCLVESCGYFYKALNIFIGYVAPEKSLNSVKNIMVDRWHYRMLNDKIRNEGYRFALENTVTRNDIVLDIGTGSGLLALYARLYRPKGIVACDCSTVMIEIATLIFEEYKVYDILLMNRMSTSLTLTNETGKYTLIVTEIFDAALFGEQILQTLEHAWVHLLAPTGRIVPARAEFFVIGAKYDFISDRYRVKKEALDLLGISENHTHLSANEPYDSEDVHLYNELRYMTEQQCVLKVDFNSLEDIRFKLYNLVNYDVTFKALEDGEIDIVVGWFNVYLTEDIILTSDPRDTNRCNAWQQAVYYDFVPMKVKKDEKILFQFQCIGGKLSLVNPVIDIQKISEEMIRFLNDSEYIKIINNSLGEIFIYMSQLIESSFFKILDLNPFPMLGLLLMRRHAKSLTCFAKNEQDRDFILKVFRENGIDTAKITVILENDLSQNSFSGGKYHLVFCNLLELSGELNIIQKHIYKRARQFHLEEEGLLLPHQVTLEGQLIYSDWLDINNMVNNVNVHNLEIAKYINKYQVSQVFDIDVSHLEYRALTEETEIGICSMEMSPVVVKMKVCDEGQVNAALCWYNIMLMEYGQKLTTKRKGSHVECTAFRAQPKINVVLGTEANVLRCVDEDDSFKLITDIE